jgi:DNA-binding NtrC family response regulator
LKTDVLPEVRVLVVDDESLIRWSLSEALEERGFNVRVAADGRTALGALSDGSARPDVVLLDYMLPDSNGLSLFERVRDLMPPRRVILMTAYGSPDVVDRALKLGAYQVVMKPFDMTDIASVIRHASVASPAA